MRKDADEFKKNPKYEEYRKKTEDNIKNGRSISDSKPSEEKDEDGNVLKQETVKDPETGKKIKVTTHTGPRGGKFYYPDGKPKKPENRVYVKESLSEYLMRQL